MIINSHEIIKGMATQERVIKVNMVTNNLSNLLKKVSNSISALNGQSSDLILRKQTHIAEKQIHTAIIQKEMNGWPLVELEKLEYTNVNYETIEYLLTPKNEKVDEYNVDIITIFFDYEEQSVVYQVLLPLYLIEDKDGSLYLLPIQTENAIVQSSLEKFKIS